MSSQEARLRYQETVSSVVSLLKACAVKADLSEGVRIHTEVVKQGLLEKSPYVRSSLVSMYAKCSALCKAQEVMDELPTRDPITWNALISGYVHEGQSDKALKCFDQMQMEGQYPNTLTFVCLLKACGNTKSLEKGRKIHDEIIRKGFVGMDVMLDTALVSMYAKCGAFSEAENAVKGFLVHGVAPFNALITGYIQFEYFEKVLDCFQQMYLKGAYPNAITFICMLKACGSIGALDKGKIFHNDIICRGLLEKDTALGNTLVFMYAKCGAIVTAEHVLYDLSVRDVFSWSALIAGYTEQGLNEGALDCFQKMQNFGIPPNEIAFISVLKSCIGSINVEKGRIIHEEIVRRGLLRDNLALGNALLEMHAKCGNLAITKQVFEEIPVHDVVSWNVLIMGYSQKGRFLEALCCFQLMQIEGCFPNSITLISILKIYGNTENYDEGSHLHTDLITREHLANDLILAAALIDMYIKCGSLQRARQVHEGLPVRDVVCWSSLITGYAQQGQGSEALHCYKQMLSEGIQPNSITFTGILKACGDIGAIEMGKKIHGDIINKKLLEKDIVLGNALLDMYIKCGWMTNAILEFGGLSYRDEGSWNTLIAGYVHQGQDEDAVKCLYRMRCEAICPDFITLNFMLRACGNSGFVEKGKQIHSENFERGVEIDDALGNSLFNMYVKCGALNEAKCMHEGLLIKDIGSFYQLLAKYAEKGWAKEALDFFKVMQIQCVCLSPFLFICILRACASCRDIDNGKRIHNIVHNSGLLGEDTLLASTLIKMYVKCGLFAEAENVLQRLPLLDVECWSVLIAGYAEQGHIEGALNSFYRMQAEGIQPDVTVFIWMLKVCGKTRALEKGKQIHDEIINRGLLDKEICVGNAIINMYMKCGDLTQAIHVFDELPMRDVVTWNSLISGYSCQRKMEESLSSFKQMQDEGIYPNAVTFISILKACGSQGAVDKGKQIHEEIIGRRILGNDFVLGSILVDMYAKCGALAKAKQVLESLPEYTIVSWNALITGYTQQENWNEALNCIHELQREGLSPDAITYICMLKVFSSIGAVKNGKQIHSEIIKVGIWGNDVVVGNALLDMYTKFGAVATAEHVLKKLQSHDVVSWNTLIAGYSKQGEGDLALDCFGRMERMGIIANAVTFSCVLSTCRYFNFVKEGNMYFMDMKTKYGIVAELHHYSCMVHMFSHAGYLAKAMTIIKKMPSSDYPPVWHALLSGCRKWGNQKLGKLAFEWVVYLDKKNAAAYVLMTSIQATACSA